MEKLLHYVWKHKMFPVRPLLTTTGESVEVIDAGLPNANAGPDFFNAKVRIGGTMWVGNIEIHDKASDWYAHGHDKDKAYDNVVLHVAAETGPDIITSDGRKVAQIRLDVPQEVSRNYDELITTDHYPPCYAIIPQLSRLTVHSWMSRLQAERLEQKTDAIRLRADRCGGSWESALFVTMARNYGFGVNGDAFEAWAMSVPLQSVAHHRDDLFQIEAIFMGQAGLLEYDTIPEPYRNDAMKEGYFDRLRKEYQYMAHKFGLTPIDAGMWKFLRMRPQNFPHSWHSSIIRAKATLAALPSVHPLSSLKPCCAPGLRLIGKLTTPSAARALRTARAFPTRRSICSSSTPPCPCSLPTAATATMTRCAAARSVCSVSCGPKTTI